MSLRLAMYDRDSVVVTEPSLGLFCSKLGNFNLQPRTLDVEELHIFSEIIQ